MTEGDFDGVRLRENYGNMAGLTIKGNPFPCLE